MSFIDKYKISAEFPTMEGDKRSPGAQNSSFLHNFFGLYMWGHIRKGYCWMTKSDLRNNVNISLMHATTDLFHQAHPELFKSLISGKGQKLKPNTIVSFCSNSRYYKTLDSYDINTTDCIGIYIKHVEILDHVGFPLGGE